MNNARFTPEEFAGEVAALGQRVARLSDLETRSKEGEELLLELTTAHEELRTAEEELRAQEEELTRLAQSQRLGRWQNERLLALLPTPVLITDRHGLVTSANAAATSTLGSRIDRLLRKPILSFIAPDDRPEVRRLLSRATRERDGDFQAAVSLRPRRGAELEIEVVGTVGRDDDGGFNGVTWVLLTPGGPAGAATQLSRREALARGLVELTTVPLHRADTRAVLNDTALICQRALGEGFVVSVTVGPPAEPELVASSDQLAQQLDGAQMLAGEGPCQTAWENSEPVLSPDLREDKRWPRLAEHLHAITVRSAVAAPIRIGDDLAGALNVYSAVHDVTDPAVKGLVEMLGEAVAAILFEITAKTELETLASQLQNALKSRATIEQAKGIVMASRGCGPDDAFAFLRKLSSERNVKLRDIAAETVHDAESQRQSGIATT